MNYMNQTTRCAQGTKYSKLRGLRAFVVKKSILLGLAVPMIGMAQTNGLTLAVLNEKVLAGNPSVHESLERITAAEAVLKQAQSAYLPTVTATASYGHIDSSLHPDTDPENRYAESYKQASAGVQANWLLFNGFAREARTLSAKYSLQQSGELADETRRLLILSATTAFRQAQQARENIDIARQDLAFNTNLEDDARKRFEAGVLPESEVHNFTINALQAESATLEAELDYKTACAVLAELMALPEPQLPEDMQPVAIAFDAGQSIPALEQEFDYALIHRPDFKALKSGQLALAQQVRAVKGDMMPTIALAGEVNYNDREDWSTTSEHGNYDSFVGVTASWDLFSGGRKKNVVKEAQAEMRALEELQEALRLSIRSTLQQQLDSAETTQAVLQRQEKIYRLSQSVRDSVEKSYKAGAVSITRLNEAQTDLVAAQGAYSTAYIAYRLILNQVDIESGRALDGLE
jgi:outer membrane protein TolC